MSMVSVYSTAIHLYGVGIRLAQPFSAKATKWVTGRENLFSKLEQVVSIGDDWIWLHAASVGEFEQGRPLIEHIRSKHPEKRILVTFFSPSGYENRKDYEGADFVTYIPLDTPANAKRFLAILKPSLVIFVKYEIWYHHFHEMVDRSIPVLLVSAQFRPEQIYFRWYGRMFMDVLKNLNHIFLADEISLKTLEQQQFQNIGLYGDTRIDRVMQIAGEHRDFGYLRDVLQSDEILIAGSTWPEDIKLLLPSINSGSLKCVIAPHENDEKRLKELEEVITVKTLRFSELHNSTSKQASVVIVDTMGDLAEIYSVGSIAYVGGGFTSGIHSILEAVAYRLPVIFGPNYKRFREAVELITLGVCKSVNTAGEFEDAFQNFNGATNKVSVSEIAGTYMDKHTGATMRIYDYIRRENLL